MPAKSLWHNETARYVGHFFSADCHFHSTDSFFDLDGNDIVDVAELDWRTTSGDANVDRDFATADFATVFAAANMTAIFRIQNGAQSIGTASACSTVPT